MKPMKAALNDGWNSNRVMGRVSPVVWLLQIGRGGGWFVHWSLCEFPKRGLVHALARRAK